MYTFLKYKTVGRPPREAHCGRDGSSSYQLSIVSNRESVTEKSKRIHRAERVPRGVRSWKYSRLMTLIQK